MSSPSHEFGVFLSRTPPPKRKKERGFLWLPLNATQKGHPEKKDKQLVAWKGWVALNGLQKTTWGTLQTAHCRLATDFLHNGNPAQKAYSEGPSAHPTAQRQAEVRCMPFLEKKPLQQKASGLQGQFRESNCQVPCFAKSC